MKTIAPTRSVIENSQPSTSFVDIDLLRASIFELIALHIDGKRNDLGHDLSDLASHLTSPTWPCSRETKAKAANIAGKVALIIDAVVDR